MVQRCSLLIAFVVLLSTHADLAQPQDDSDGVSAIPRTTRRVTRGGTKGSSTGRTQNNSESVRKLQWEKGKIFNRIKTAIPFFKRPDAPSPTAESPTVSPTRFSTQVPFEQPSEPPGNPTTKSPTVSPTRFSAGPTTETSQPSTETSEPLSSAPSIIMSAGPSAETKEPSSSAGPSTEAREPSLYPSSFSTEIPVQPPSPPPANHDAEHCGCRSCTETVWSADANGFTCGDRINYLQDAYSEAFPTQQDACRRIAYMEYPNACGACDPDRCDGQTPPTPPASYCGCDTCTHNVWFQDAWGQTCGARMEWLELTNPDSYPSQEAACSQVSSEFPTICGPSCDPYLCRGIQPYEPPESDLIPLTPTSPLYCFLDHADRVRWENVWGKYTVEVKEGVCGPSDNRFARETVWFNPVTDELTLQFRKIFDGAWAGSEVRIVLPEDEMPYTYGTYSFSVKSVVWRDVNDQFISNVLPPSLVLGLFTYDTTERFDLRENWMHEVDIELSRWGDRENPHDAQFLVQPPEQPYWRTFSTAATEGGPFDQGGHVYQFDWNPGEIVWYTDAAGGLSHNYTTQQALDLNLPDRVQCLPADAEVRINLWNMLGMETPMDMEQDGVVEVVIENFTFTPSGITSVADGDVCSKDCQCAETSVCLANQCTAVAQ